MARFNLSGWKLGKWIKGNGSTIKELIKVGLPLLLGWAVTHSPTWTTFITVGGKLLLDTVDYYIAK